MTDQKIQELWFKATDWDIAGYSRTMDDLRKYTEAVLTQERSKVAELVEQMGIEGYGTLAIAAAIRAGNAPEAVETSSPAELRRKANSPWDDKASY